MDIQNISAVSQTDQPFLRINSSGSAGVVAATPAQKVPSQSSVEDLERAVAAVNQAMQQSGRNLEFSVDSDSQKTIVRVVDTRTGELIRQVPTETALEISRSIDQFQRGLLLNQTA